MSYRDLGQVKTYITTTDLSAEDKQYTFVKTTGAVFEGLQVVTTAAAGEDAVGVQWNRPEAGHAVAVVVDANAEPHMIASEAIAIGDEIAASATGTAAVAAAGDTVLGTAKSAAQAGGYVTVELLGNSKYTKA